MVADIYDSTLIYDPEGGDIEMTGEVECPGCGERVFPDLTDEVIDAALDYGIEAPFDCPGCDTDLVFIIEPTPTDDVGLGIAVVRGPA
jgi:hypothetical protein